MTVWAAWTSQEASLARDKSELGQGSRVESVKHSAGTHWGCSDACSWSFSLRSKLLVSTS